MSVKRRLQRVESDLKRVRRRKLDRPEYWSVAILMSDGMVHWNGMEMTEEEYNETYAERCHLPMIEVVPASVALAREQTGGGF